MGELPHDPEYRDAIAMTLALERGDKQAWSALFLPYVERFISGDRQATANLVTSLSGMISNLGRQLAEMHGLTFERNSSRSATRILPVAANGWQGGIVDALIRPRAVQLGQPPSQSGHHR